jgi:hypothetical protein
MSKEDIKSYSEQLKAFVNWQNDNYPENYIPNSRIGLYNTSTAYYEDDSVVIPVDDNRQMFLEHEGDDHTMLTTMRIVRDDEDLKNIIKTKAGVLYSDITNKETYWENNLLFVNKSLFALADGIDIYFTNQKAANVKYKMS